LVDVLSYSIFIAHMASKGEPLVIDSGLFAGAHYAVLEIFDQVKKRPVQIRPSVLQPE